MKRRTSVFAVAAMVASLVVPAGPAHADLAVCAAAGTASLSEGIYFTPLVPVLGTQPREIVNWDITATEAACAPSGLAPLYGTGLLYSASCGNSVGSGTVTHNGNDHEVSVTTSLTMMIVNRRGFGLLRGRAGPAGPMCLSGGLR